VEDSVGRRRVRSLTLHKHERPVLGVVGINDITAN